MKTPKYVRDQKKRKPPAKVPSPVYTSDESIEFLKQRDKDYRNETKQEKAKKREEMRRKLALD